MKREEQIEVATAAYINGRLRNNVPQEEIEEIRLAYQAGAIYADEHPINYDGKAMLHVLHKGAAIGRREMLDKVCQYLFENYHGEKLSLRMIEDLRKAMLEEEQ